MLFRSGGKPGTRWQVTVRGPDLSAVAKVSWMAGTLAAELPRIRWQPGANYRIYVTPLAAEGLGASAADSANEPSLCSEFVFAPNEAPGTDSAATLAKAMQWVESGSVCAALMALDGLRADSFADDRLALLWSTLRVRSLLGAGYSGEPLEHAVRDFAISQRAVHAQRTRELLLLLQAANPRSQVALDYIAALEAAVPVASPQGSWARLAVARYQLDGGGHPSLALKHVDAVIAALRLSPEWEEADRLLLVANAPVLAITQPTRTRAGSTADALAHALVLQIGRAHV